MPMLMGVLPDGWYGVATGKITHFAALRSDKTIIP